jgi:hypothetical protein
MAMGGRVRSFFARPMRICPSIFLLGLLLSCRMLFAQSPAGLWIDKDKNTFELLGGATITGKIRSLNPPATPDGRTLTDIHNADPAARQVPLVGLVFMKNFKPAGPGLWNGGTIYDPKSGKTYSCDLRMEGDDTLALHGFIGISLFGRTEYWKRLAPAALPGNTSSAPLRLSR